MNNSITLAMQGRVQLGSGLNPFILNRNRLSNFRAKRLLQNTTDSIINIATFGTSIGEGYYAENPTTPTTRNTKSYSGLLSEYFKTKVGDVGVGWKPAYSTVTGSEWTLAPEEAWNRQGSLSENLRKYRETLTANAYAECQFSGVAVDVILMKRDYAPSACQIIVDGVLNKTVNLRLPGDVGEIQPFLVSIDGLSNGVHTLKILTPTASYLGVLGLHERSTTNGVSVINFSKNGAHSGYIYPTLYSKETIDSLSIIPLDVVIFEYIANETISQSDYKTRLSGYVDLALSNGSEVIILAAGMNTSAYIFDTEGLKYHDTARQVAIEKNVCFVDIFELWKDICIAGTLSTKLFDTQHPNALGHLDIFNLLLKALEA